MIDILDNKKYSDHLIQGIQIVADCSPATIFGYSDIHQIDRFYADNLCWQTGRMEGTPFYFPPYGDWDAVNWKEILKKHIQPGTLFRYVPEYLLNLWVCQLPKEIDFEEDVNEFDYIYYIDRQVASEGKYYASFRRIRNKFEKTYDFTLEEISKENFHDVLEIHTTFFELTQGTERCNDELANENISFHKVVSAWDAFDLQGMLLYVEGKPVAYNIWERLDEVNTLGLYAKADPRNPHASTYLLLRLLDNLDAAGYVLVNAMSDVGIPGLRNAKKSQNPITMLKKYSVIYTG